MFSLPVYEKDRPQYGNRFYALHRQRAQSRIMRSRFQLRVTIFGHSGEIYIASFKVSTQRSFRPNQVEKIVLSDRWNSEEASDGGSLLPEEVRPRHRVKDLWHVVCPSVPLSLTTVINGSVGLRINGKSCDALALLSMTAALVNKLEFCAWLLSGALEVG